MMSAAVRGALVAWSVAVFPRAGASIVVNGTQPGFKRLWDSYGFERGGDLFPSRCPNSDCNGRCVASVNGEKGTSCPHCRPSIVSVGGTKAVQCSVDWTQKNYRSEIVPRDDHNCNTHTDNNCYLQPQWGKTYIVSWSLRLNNWGPAGDKCDAVVMQLHNPTLMKPPRVSLVLSDGGLDLWWGPRTNIMAREELNNCWHQLVMHVKVDQGSSGIVELYVDGTKKYSRSGTNTGLPGKLAPNFKFGIYQRAFEGNQCKSLKKSLYIDNLTVDVNDGDSQTVVV